jgi:citronellol/citronellal dehydrogenase
MFTNRTFIITGASRGIGKAIALKLAKEGANIVIASKSVQEDNRLGGTIYSAAQEVEAAGGNALAVPCDIRFEDQIENVINQAAERFGGIDGVINNASAISLTKSEQTETKRFDLMHNINVRGTFLVTRHCIPYLKRSANPHILTLSPPLNITPEWLGISVPYSISKYNMSMMALGWSAELKQYGIAANALWPVTTIATAAVQNLLGGDDMVARSRTPDIVADAACYILSQPAREFTGNLVLDEDVLKKAGITDFSGYAVTPGGSLQKDLFV